MTATRLFYILLAMTLWGVQAAETTIRLSESDSVEVSSRADWHTKPGQGWYIKEHYHADDFAFLVCDDQSVGSSFVYDLGTWVEPGTYNLLLRHVRMRHGTENRLRFELGTGTSDAFVALGNSELSWTHKDMPRNYRWAETRITSTGRANRLRVTAVAVGRSGIGDVPEYPLNTILLDTMILTSRVNYTITHGNRSSTLEMTGLEQWTGRVSEPPAKRNHVWAAPDPEVLTRVQVIDPVGTEAVTERVTTGNLVADGSFEAGTQPNWFVIKRSTTGYELTRDFLDSEQPGHGTSSLRLRGSTSFYGGSDNKILLTSAPFVASPGTYTCSFMVRSDAPEVSLEVKAAGYLRDEARFKTGEVFGSIKPDVGTAWKTHQFTFTLKTSEIVQMSFAADDFSGDIDARGLTATSLWLDAVTVSQDSAEYVPASPVELGLFSKTQRLFHLGKLAFDLRVAAYDGRQNATVTYTILNLAWEPIATGTVDLALDTDGIGESHLEIPFQRRGAYLIQLSAEDARDVVLDISVVDDPKGNPAAPNFGLYTSYKPEAMDYFSRAGAGYYLTLCDGAMIRPYRTLTLPREYKGKTPETSAERVAWLAAADMQTYDDIVRRIQALGIEVIPEFLARELPKWARDDPAAFAAHVQRVVAHYKTLGVKRWMTGDEVRLPYRPYHQAAAEAIKAEQPEAEIMISTAPGVIERFSEDMGGDALVSAIGGSNWNTSKWLYHAKAEAQDRMKLPFWNVGVGWASRPAYAYDPHALRMNLRKGRFNVVTNLLYCQAIAAPEILTTYVNRFTNGRAFGTNDMYTGTFVPHGAYFAAATGFVRGATRGDEIELTEASDLDAFYFQRNERTTVVICQSQAFWGSPRGESSFDLTLSADPSRLGFYDIDLSEVDAPTSGGSSFTWHLPLYGALILEDRGLGKAALLEAVANLKASKKHDSRYLVIGRPDGTLDLGLWLRNGLDTTFKGTLEMDRRLTLSPEAQGSRSVQIGPGESTLLRFQLPAKMGTSRPIGNLVVNHTFSDNKSFALGSEAHLWAACAKRREPVANASGTKAWRTDELVGYIYASSRIGGGYGLEQVRRGGTPFVRADAFEMGARLFARWQPDKLMLALDLDELSTQQLDQAMIAIDPGLMTALAGVSSTIAPQTFAVDLHSGTSQDKRITVQRHADKDTSWVEIEIPADALGSTLAPTSTFGFNVMLEGSAPGSDSPLQMVYSGRPNFLPNDPMGWAQLILLP